MTSIDFGISGRSSAPVESSTRGESIDSDGILVGCEPSRQDHVVDADGLLAAVGLLHLAVVFGSTIEAQPCR